MKHAPGKTESEESANVQESRDPEMICIVFYAVLICARLDSDCRRSINFVWLRVKAVLL